MKRIRCGSGLGDSIYLQSVVRHLVGKGEQLEVCTDYPDVFLPLAGKVHLAPFGKERIQILAHYSTRKGIAATDQFEDCCINAGICEPVEMRLDWVPQNTALVDQLRAAGKPVVCVQLPRAPMGRTDGFGKELMPDCRVIQRAIDEVRSWAYLVQLGSGEPLFNFKGIHLDLADRTTVADLIDVGCAADGFFGFVSYFVPLAESFDKPALFVWSRRGLNAPKTFVRQITPHKVLHKDTSRFVMDDAPGDELKGELDAFRRTVESRRAAR